MGMLGEYDPADRFSTLGGGLLDVVNHLIGMLRGLGIAKVNRQRFGLALHLGIVVPVQFGIGGGPGGRRLAELALEALLKSRECPAAYGNVFDVRGELDRFRKRFGLTLGN